MVNKPLTPIEDADLMTHLLQTCPIKWQSQYDIMTQSTPVSTRDLLLVLEKSKRSMQLNEKPPSKEKVKGADPKHKMDSIEARIPKMARKGWTDKHCFLCKSQVTSSRT